MNQSSLTGHRNSNINRSTSNARPRHSVFAHAPLAFPSFESPRPYASVNQEISTTSRSTCFKMLPGSTIGAYPNHASANPKTNTSTQAKRRVCRFRTTKWILAGIRRTTQQGRHSDSPSHRDIGLPTRGERQMRPPRSIGPIPARSVTRYSARVRYARVFIGTSNRSSPCASRSSFESSASKRPRSVGVTALRM